MHLCLASFQLMSEKCNVEVVVKIKKNYHIVEHFFWGVWANMSRAASKAILKDIIHCIYADKEMLKVTKLMVKIQFHKQVEVFCYCWQNDKGSNIRYQMFQIDQMHVFTLSKYAAISFMVVSIKTHVSVRS